MSIKGHWHRKTDKSISDRELEIRWALAISETSEKEKRNLLKELEKIIADKNNE